MHCGGAGAEGSSTRVIRPAQQAQDISPDRAAAAAEGSAVQITPAAAGEGAARPREPPTMVDVFAGLGTVSLAAADSGFKVRRAMPCQRCLMALLLVLEG